MLLSSFASKPFGLNWQDSWRLPFPKRMGTEQAHLTIHPCYGTTTSPWTSDCDSKVAEKQCHFTSTWLILPNDGMVIGLILEQKKV
jgi:hypothetical protein